MQNNDHFIHEFVRIRHKLTVPQAAKRMGVTPATWRLWEVGTTGMNHSRWDKFNQAFGTTLSMDNVKNGGPASGADMDAFCDLKDAGETPKAVPAPKLTPNERRRATDKRNARELCKALRSALSASQAASQAASQYDAAVHVGVTLKQWASWESADVPPSRHHMAKLRQALLELQAPCSPDNVTATANNLEPTYA